jgi:hypothetical protein
MTKDQIVEYLHKQADDIDSNVPLKESPEAYIAAIGVPLVDWVLANMSHEGKNDAIRIALEQMRGLMFGIAETY